MNPAWSNSPVVDIRGQSAEREKGELSTRNAMGALEKDACSTMRMPAESRVRYSLAFRQQINPLPTAHAICRLHVQGQTKAFRLTAKLRLSPLMTFQIYEVVRRIGASHVYRAGTEPNHLRTGAQGGRTE